MATSDLTAERLRELLHYDPETGVFTTKREAGRLRPGSRAGAVHVEGYRNVELDRIKYREHRLAWLYVTGEWPINTIDHINGDRADNRFANLRDVTRSVNKQNTRKAYKRTSSGFLGVSYHQGLWQANIQVNNKQFYLGRHKTPEEAHEVYLKAKREMHEGNTL